MAVNSAGKIVVSLSAGTATFIADLDKANAKIKDFGQKARESGAASRTSFIEASAAIRGIEGNFDRNIRAVERFASTTLGLGPIFKTLFPVIGGIAFGTMLVELGEKVTNFIKQLKAAPEALTGAVQGLAASSRSANDEIELTTVKLQNQIALLQGKHENVLKEMIYEARVEADHLADSLAKANQNLYEFIAKNQIGKLKQAADEVIHGLPDELRGTIQNLQHQLGGYLGAGGEAERVRTINATANQELTAAAQLPTRTPEEQKAAALAKSNALQKQTNALAQEYKHQIDQVNSALAPFLKLQQQQWEQEKAIKEGKIETGAAGGIDTDPLGGAITNQLQGHIDLGPYIELINAIRDDLAQKLRQVTATAAQETAKEGLIGARANKLEARQDVAGKALNDLQARVKESVDLIAKAGLGETNRVIAEAESEAIKAIEKVNDRLHQQGRAVYDLKQPFQTAFGFQVLGLTTIEAQNKATAARTAEIVKITTELQDEIKTQQLLSDAIGKGWEFQKKLNVEIDLMHKLGSKSYVESSNADPNSAQGKALAAARTDAQTAAELKHVDSIKQSAEALRNEAAMEQVLAQAQALGAYAVERTAVAEQIRQGYAREGAAYAIQAQKEWDKFNASQINKASQEIAKIDQQISAIQRLTAARVQGSEAVRKAELESQVAEVRRQYSSAPIPGVIGGLSAADLAEIAVRTKDASEQQDKLTETVVARLDPYEKELDQLTRQRDVLTTMVALGDNSLNTARALHDVQDDILKIYVKEDLAQRSALDGVHAFFTEMQEQTKSSAQITYEAFNSAFDKIADNFSKLITRQKTDWAKSFKDVGDNLVKSSVKSGLQTGLGELGKAFPGLAGITGAAQKALGKKADGQTAETALWVKIAGSIAGGGGTGGIVGGGGGGTRGSGGPGDVIFGNGGLLGTGEVPGSDQGSQGQARPQGQTGGGWSGFFKTLLQGILGVKSNQSQSGIGGGSTGSSSDASGGVGGSGDIGSDFDIGDDIPAFAGGGDYTPGTTAIVGEAGPELFRSSVGGHISNASATRSALSGGDNHYYTIDARGTDPNLTGQRVEAAIRASQASSVSMSIRAQHEQSARRPSRSN